MKKYFQNEDSATQVALVVTLFVLFFLISVFRAFGDQPPDPSMIDGKAFRVNSSRGVPPMFVVDTAGTNTVTNGVGAAARITTNRSVHTTLRDGRGRERGATVKNLSNADPLDVAIVDSNGDQVTSFGGGTQYTAGTTNAVAIGNIILWQETNGITRVVTPAQALPVGFTNTVIAATQSGTWNLNNISGTISLPTGASTAALQQDLTNLVTVFSAKFNKGQTNKANSVSVTLASDQGAILVDGSAVTQPISAASLPLPTGAATETTLATLALEATQKQSTNYLRQIFDKVNAGPTNTVNVNITGGSSAGPTYVVDAVSIAAPTGSVMIVKRVDSGTSLAGSDGDYTWLQVDANGALRVTGGGGGTEYVENTTNATATVKIMGYQETNGISRAVKPTQPLPVLLTNLVSVTYGGGTFIVGDGAGALTVDGTVTANAGSGTFTTAESQVITDNGGFTDGTSKLFMGGFIFDETAGTALTENDAGAARMTSNRVVIASLEDSTVRGRRATVSAGGALLVDGSATTQPISGTVTANGGSGIFSNDFKTIGGTAVSVGAGTVGNGVQRTTLASDDPAVAALQYLTNGHSAIYKTTAAGVMFSNVVKASAGRFYGAYVGNTNASPVYIRLFNVAVATNQSTQVPIWGAIVPGLATNGAGNNALVPVPGGIACNTGMYIVVSGLPTTNDTTTVTGIYPVSVVYD